MSRKYRALSFREIRQGMNSRQVREYEKEQLKQRAI